MDRAVFIHNTLRDFVSHLTFRVTDDDIIVRHEERITDLTLCAEGFTGTGSAQNQAIRVFQLFAVHHDEVVGKRIQAVVQRFFSALVQFLRGKGDEDSRAAGGQSPLNFDLAVCQRQRGHKPLLLLEIQPAQIAVVLLGDGAGLKDVVFQFLLGLAGVQHQKSDKEHPLVLALQFLQKCLGISAVGCQIGRQ